MMNTIERIFGELRAIRLSERERKNMRLSLQTHMSGNPARDSFGIRMSNFFSGTGTAISDALNSRTFATHPAFAACVLVLCIGVGTSYAAQSALPGQSLYSFKTRVNEPLQGVLALTPEAKVEWNAELTTRRLREAEVLAATNQLSPIATADIETGLETAVQNFNANVALMADDSVDAVNAQSDLEASLNAHETVLASLPTKQKENSTHITALVRKHADTIGAERTSTVAAITATDTPAIKTAVLTQQKKVKDKINRVKLLSKNTADMQVASSVVAITEEASTDVNVGETDAQKGNWGRAYNAFQDAMRKMKETEDSVDTRNWLKAKFGIGLEASSTSTSTGTTTPNKTKKGDQILNVKINLDDED